MLLAAALAGACAAPNTSRPSTGTKIDPARPAAPRPETTPMYPPTEYTISLPHPHTQTAQISMTLRDLSEPSIDIAIPVWRPGRYQVLDQAGTISAILASTDADLPLPIEKTDKSTWRVQTLGHSRVTISYRLYANSLSDRTRHIDDTHAFLSPASVLMYAPQRRHAPAHVTIHAPPGWRTSTGLEADADSRFIAPDYDTLVDSPFEIGLHDLHSFDVDGIPHDIVIWHAASAHSHAPAYDPEQLKRDFAAIVRVQRDLFGDLPYSRYVFQIHSGPGLSGGTEHLNSTIMQTSRATFEDPAAYKRFLGLVSHEMFHTWNIKQLRPADLTPYAYAHEDYTRLLWLVEGTTSYYDDLCLVRAGLMSQDDYIDMIENMIITELARPGWHEQSLEESSFDAWIKFNKPTPDAANSTVSFYSKGALISLLLDMELRARTSSPDSAHPPASLDDAMRTLYQRFPRGGPGYTTRDVLDVLHELTGSSFDDFFAQYIAGTAVPDFSQVFTPVGLSASCGDNTSKPYLGLALAEKEGKTLVASVLADSPAYRAGLMPDDEILALNNRRLRKDDFDKRLKLHKPGDTLTFTLFRRDELRSLPVTLAPSPTAQWTVSPDTNSTPAQIQARRTWLGQ